MSNSNEWRKPAVSGNSCAYSNLGMYNTGSQGVGIAAMRQNAALILPTFSPPPGYSTVAFSAVPSCSGYPSMLVAYGGGRGAASACGVQYASDLCN
jgi:hypothetical protein